MDNSLPEKIILQKATKSNKKLGKKGISKKRNKQAARFRTAYFVYYVYLFYQIFKSGVKSFGQCGQLDVGHKPFAALNSLNCIFVYIKSE